MKIWKQKYGVVFEVNEELFIKKNLTFDEQEKKEEKELVDIAKKNISIHLGLDLDGVPFKIETKVFIESTTQEAYVLAKWMYNHEIKLCSGYALMNAIRETNVDFKETSFDETEEVLKMIHLLTDEEII
jgi:hypothetical protein